MAHSPISISRPSHSKMSWDPHMSMSRVPLRPAYIIQPAPRHLNHHTFFGLFSLSLFVPKARTQFQILIASTYRMFWCVITSAESICVCGNIWLIWISRPPPLLTFCVPCCWFLTHGPFDSGQAIYLSLVFTTADCSGNLLSFLSGEVVCRHRMGKGWRACPRRRQHGLVFRTLERKIGEGGQIYKWIQWGYNQWQDEANNCEGSA